MYVILTSKPGKFRTEPGDALRPVEAYDYLFYGERKARFVIAELTVRAEAAATRVRVIDEAPPPTVNDIPAKFLPRFDTIEAARRELHHLVGFGSLRTELRPAAIPEAGGPVA